MAAGDAQRIQTYYACATAFPAILLSYRAFVSLSPEWRNWLICIQILGVVYFWNKAIFSGIPQWEKERRFQQKVHSFSSREDLFILLYDIGTFTPLNRLMRRGINYPRWEIVEKNICQYQFLYLYGWGMKKRKEAEKLLGMKPTKMNDGTLIFPIEESKTCQK